MALTIASAKIPGLEEPERIGKYQVIRKLGEGATSAVYLCEDPFNKRQVAVKRVHAEAQRVMALPDGATESTR